MIRHPKNRLGFSLLELLAVVTIMGIIAIIVVPRISMTADFAKQNANSQNISEINTAVERYQLDNGSLPDTISDLDTADYFPDGIPSNPVNGQPYALHAVTKRVQQGGGGGGK